MVTAPRQGPEALERALVATLKAHLTVELDAQWAVYAADDASDAAAGLPTPQKVYPVNYFVGERDEIYDYPSVLVIADDGAQNANGAGEGWGDVDHRLTVIAYVVGDDVHALDMASKRYLMALWQVLMKYQGLDSTVGQLVGVDPRGYGRTPTTQIDVHPGLMRAVAWTVVAHTLQTVSW